MKLGPWAQCVQFKHVFPLIHDSFEGMKAMWRIANFPLQKLGTLCAVLIIDRWEIAITTPTITAIILLIIIIMIISVKETTTGPVLSRYCLNKGPFSAWYTSAPDGQQTITVYVQLHLQGGWHIKAKPEEIRWKTYWVQMLSDMCAASINHTITIPSNHTDAQLTTNRLYLHRKGYWGQQFMNTSLQRGMHIWYMDVVYTDTCQHRNKWSDETPHLLAIHKICLANMLDSAVDHHYHSTISPHSTSPLRLQQFTKCKHNCIWAVQMDWCFLC